MDASDFYGPDIYACDFDVDVVERPRPSIELPPSTAFATREEAERYLALISRRTSKREDLYVQEILVTTVDQALRPWAKQSDE